MVKLFTARELAECLGINPAKWKRWVREFLPPDPLAGMQSGYARQFYVNDAFTVFLAGHLVAELKFSISDARTILKDLSPWMRESGFRFNPDGTLSLADLPLRVLSHTVIVRFLPGRGFAYTVRGLVQRSNAVHQGADVYEEIVEETGLGVVADGSLPLEAASPKMIELTHLRRWFLSKVDPKQSYFPKN
jgi:hypothetical protein